MRKTDMADIQITMFAKFDILVDGRSALTFLGNSTKSVLLLKWLIFNNGKAVSSASLIDMFWSGSDKSANPESALKTMLSRIRSHMVAASPLFASCIVYENQSYRWNTTISYEIDVFKFEALCAELAGTKELTDAVRAQYIKILELYPGDIACTGSEEDWIVSRSMYYNHLYLQNVHAFIDLLRQGQDYETIIHVCRIALDIDSFDERLNMELMEALKKSGQHNMAIMQYRHITDAYYKYLGVTPSPQMLDFYKALIKEDLSAETDVATIRKALKGSKEEGGAFICDYSIFKDIYRLQIRNLNRQESKMFLVLLSVTPCLADSFDPFVLDGIMRELLDILKKCMRKGDTITRYSSAQYAVLLPMVNHSGGSIAINRIKKMFYHKYSDNAVKLISHLSIIEEDD